MTYQYRTLITTIHINMAMKSSQQFVWKDVFYDILLMLG